MKKLLLICAAAAMMLGVASCSHKGDQGEKGMFEDEAFRDSVTELAGRAFGQDANTQLRYYLGNLSDSARAEFDKEAFLRGVVHALKTDTTDQSYLMGYQQGVQMLGFLLQQNNGARIDVDQFIKVFSAEFLKDSIAPEEMSKTAAEFQNMLQRVNLEKKRRADLARENDPVAIANKNAGAKAIADAKAANPAIKTSESGLAYEIINPGEGDKVTYNSTAEVIYTGKLVDGKVFDSSNGEPRPFQVQGVIRGFSEGLQLLGKGGKAILYIPADLAYGINGEPRAGIGPNSTLIFEIEVVDFTDPTVANKPMQPAQPTQPAN